MAKIVFLWILGSALALAPGIYFQAPMANAKFHLPLKRKEAPVFSLNLLADGGNPKQRDGIDSEFRIGLGRARIIISPDDGASITGEGKDRKAWEVKIKTFPIGLGYEVYSGDLDNNGSVDLVLI